MAEKQGSVQLPQGLSFEFDQGGPGFDPRHPDCRRQSSRGPHPHCPRQLRRTKNLFNLSLCILVNTFKEKCQIGFKWKLQKNDLNCTWSSTFLTFN